MGQKVHPIGFRLGTTRTWDSRWFATRDYANLLHEDIKLREYIKKTRTFAAISRVEIERAADKVRVNLHTARPGIVIGRKGADIDKLRQELEEMTGKQVLVNIHEVKNPELEAQLVAENVAEQLVRRIGFRRAMKRAIGAAMDLGAAGVRIACAGRLAGAEMSRREWYREGRVPLHTLRAKVDYGFAEARTTYGMIGVKVWLYRGEELEKKMEERKRASIGARGRPRTPSRG